MNGCRNLDIDAQREVKTHFSLLRLGVYVDAFLEAWTSSVLPLAE
jgi:hypothetical protein